MIDWLFDTLVTTGILIAAILVVRQPVARLFGPGVAYTLWALPIIRLFLPPLVLPASQAAEPSLILVSALAADETVAAVPATGAEALSAGMPLAQIAFFAWLAGALAYLVWRAWSYRAMRRELLADARPLGDAGKVRIVESPAVSVPVAFGVLDKVVALPVGFLRSVSRDEAEFALVHELEHHAGNDLAANIAMQPLLALHWFNPLGWLAWRAMRADQEAACDARVMAGHGRHSRECYGRLIASFAAGQRIALAAPMSGPLFGKRPIVHRLKSLAAPEASPRRRMLGRSMVGTCALCLPLTATISYAAPGDDDEKRVERRIERKIIVRKGDTCPEGKKAHLHERTVERGGKTFSFRTSEPMSDADIESEIAQVEAELPEPPAMPEPPVAPDAPDAPPAHSAPPAPPAPHAFAAGFDSATFERRLRARIPTEVRLTCDGRTYVMKLDRDGEIDERQMNAFEVCMDRFANRQALQGLRQARAAQVAALREQRTAGAGRVVAEKGQAESLSHHREAIEALRETLREIDAEIAELTNQS